MSKQKNKLVCNNPKALKALLDNEATVDTSTSGVCKYTYSKGKIVNVFDNGTVNFQGKNEPNCNIEQAIIERITMINKPICEDTTKQSSQ
jgi:hypothetical protein